MDKNYRAKDLKEAINFLKTQDKTIKTSNRKSDMLALLLNLGYDMSTIPTVEGKKKAEKMFNFMKSGGSSRRSLKNLTKEEISALPKVKKSRKAPVAAPAPPVAAPPPPKASEAKDSKTKKTYDIDNLKMVGKNEEEFQVLNLEKAYKVVDKYLTKNNSEYGKLRKDLNTMIKKSNKYEEQIKADKNNEDLKVENRKLGLLIGQQHTKMRNIMGKEFGLFSNYLYYKPNFQDYN